MLSLEPRKFDQYSISLLKFSDHIFFLFYAKYTIKKVLFEDKHGIDTVTIELKFSHCT